MQTIIRGTSLAMILCASATAQSQLEAKAIPSATKSAGIYHVSTGTWTRGVSATASLGPDTVYDNSVATGYFGNLGTLGSAGDFSIIDEGRLPGPSSSVALADRTDYEINGVTFSYCTDQAGPTICLTFKFYESYAPCDLVATAPLAPFTLSSCVSATGLPGSGTAGVVACWIVTLDLEGAAEFCLESEGGDQFPDHDGDLVTDSFGIEWIFTNVNTGTTGPVLAGDPDWTPSVTGALLHGGSGTYYDNTGMSTCGNTGLDTQDFFALDGLNSPFAPGCYFFGGYLNTNGCGGPQNNPFSSFSTVLFANAGECDVAPVETFCEPAGFNSSGNAAMLCVSTIATGAGVHLDAVGGPKLASSGFGFFVVADSTTGGVALGDGTLCLGSPQGRYNPAAGGARNSLGQFDLTGKFANLAGTSTTGFGFDVPLDLPSPPGGVILDGSTWHFQLWYRDLNPGTTVNFSNGVSIEFDL